VVVSQGRSIRTLGVTQQRAKLQLAGYERGQRGHDYLQGHWSSKFLTMCKTKRVRTTTEGKGGPWTWRISVLGWYCGGKMDIPLCRKEIKGGPPTVLIGRKRLQEKWKPRRSGHRPRSCQDGRGKLWALVRNHVSEWRTHST